MANADAKALFKDLTGSSLSWLPEPYKSFKKMKQINSSSPEEEKAQKSSYNDSDNVLLNSYAVSALLEFIKGDKSSIGIVRIRKGAYAAQQDIGGGRILLSSAMENGSLRAVTVTGGSYEHVPTLGNSTTVFNCSSILAMFMLIEAERNSEKADSTANMISMELLMKAVEEHRSHPQAGISEGIVRLVSDCLESGLTNGKIPCSIPNGNIPVLSKNDVESGVFDKGKIVCGKPDLLKKDLDDKDNIFGATTIADMRALVKPYTDTLRWSAYEEVMIPSFPDDMPVPKEIVKVINRFVHSRNMKEPMNNFCWRGITGYGKSTGVAIMACILHTPLVWMTCSTTDEKTNFMAQFVPSEDATVLDELPDFNTIAYDPAYAYKLITGMDDFDVTQNDVLRAYGEACAIRSKSSHFKLVESDFVKALASGWIVEIQEFSRIRDPGVLVGLNNFDKPGAVIPLVSGDYRTRHPNAICFWTDNIGYNSCRPVDPSFLRRLAFIIDSKMLPKKDVLERIKRNTGFKNDTLLEKMYTIWKALIEFCKEKQITDGDISVCELENWVKCVLIDGESALFEAALECVASKASADFESQEQLYTKLESLFAAQKLF